MISHKRDYCNYKLISKGQHFLTSSGLAQFVHFLGTGSNEMH